MVASKVDNFSANVTESLSYAVFGFNYIISHALDINNHGINSEEILNLIIIHTQIKV